MCFFGVSMIALGAVLPTLTSTLGLTPEQVTDLATLLPIGMLAGSVVFGPVVDRFGHKLMLIGNCLLVLAGTLGVAFAAGAPLLKASIIAIGFGGGVLNGETNALVSDIYDGKRRASRLSFLGVFYGLGALTIPLLLATLEESYDYTTILCGIAVLMAVGVIVCLAMRFPAPKQPQGFPLREAGKVITNPMMLLLAFILFFQSGTEGITNNWTTSFLAADGYTNTDAQLALTAMLIGLTAARLLQGMLFSRLDPRRVLCLSLGIAAAGYAVLLAAPSALSVAGAMVLVGAGLASTFPVILGILGERFAALSGTAFSVALVVALCGQTALNFLAGSIGAVFFPWVALGAVAAMLVLFAVYGASSKSALNTSNQS
ncbi:MAG: MFS transporter [Muribaculaceae bacterium]|nr:MFS transporter [Muribaculaceae bacterium]